MCGIAGVKRMGKLGEAAPIALEQIQQLLLSIQSRGFDATGVAFGYANGEVRVHKSPLVAWNFLKSKNFEAWLAANPLEEVDTVLLHTRAATVGSPTDNNNNHPLFAGTGAAVVHNGGIGNHDALFNELKLLRNGDVDSDIIRAIISEQGIKKHIGKHLNRMNGAAAIAALHTAYPRKLILGRSGSPLVLAMLEESNHLVWASTKEAIHAQARQWVNKWGLEFKRNRVDLKFNPMDHETLYLLDENGVIKENGVLWHEEFKTNGGRPHNPTYNCPDKFASQQKKNNEAAKVTAVKVTVIKAGEPVKAAPALELPEYIKCPNAACPVTARLSPEHRKQKQWDLRCTRCKALLGDVPKEEQN